MLGTNDHPGDYRSSGCTACHVVYANDRSHAQLRPLRRRSATAALTQTVDPTIPKDEPGHPLKHVFTRAIPSSQCMTCHMHPGTNMVVDLPRLHLVGQRGRRPAHVPEGAEEALRRGAGRASRTRNPEGAALAGLWSDRNFLADVSDLEPEGEEHAVRRLPRPRLGLPRRLQARTARANLLDAGGQDRRRRRSRQVPEGRPHEGHPPREGDALRGLPLQAGQPRQRQALRRAARGDRDRLRRLPRHRRRSRRPSITSGPASAGHRTSAALSHALRRSRASRSRRRQDHAAQHGRPKASSGRSRRSWTR